MLLDVTDTIFSLSPWLLLGAFVSVPLAYWRDRRTGANHEPNQSKKRTLLLVSGGYAALIIGSIGLAVLGEAGLSLFFLSCFFAGVLAIAGIVSGAGTKGWTRIAALISGAVMLFVLVFSMTHCDL